ncbi:hypothetical protein FSHL1_007635 [Fusarium sambucinum]
MDVLVVGTGPSAETMELTQAMQSQSQSPFTIYTYTEMSPEMIGQPRGKFGDWTSPIDYKKLDISQDLLAQSLSGNSFDLVVSSNVSYNSTGIDTASGHIKNLMKPGGRLVLMEPLRMVMSLISLGVQLNGMPASENLA